MTALHSPEFLRTIEEGLAGHRAFGDSAYILDQFQTSSQRRLGVIAAGLPSAGRLLDALERTDSTGRIRVFGHTVVRSAIQHAHVQVETNEEYGLPIGDCDKVFEVTTRHLELKRPRTPFESSPFRLPRLGGKPHHGWIWSEDYPKDIFGRSFRSLIEGNWGATLATPSDDDIAALKKGVRLLDALMPLLTASALSHVQVVGVFDQGDGWNRTASSSQFRVGGAIMLARSLFRSPWTVAEHVLHESLHHKLYDFRHGHSLLKPEAQMRDAPRVRSPWNPAELNELNQWDIHRVFAAFHVYVQLAVLSLIAKNRAKELEELYGPADGMIDSKKAFERAWYLGEQLKDGRVWNLLGLAGQRMVDWMLSVLDVLEFPPPPRGADFHLVLDLYWREARGVDSGQSAASDHLSQLGRLAEDEVESTRRILSAIPAEPLLDQFNDDIGQFADDELGANFTSVREGIAWTLLNASPDGYGLKSAVPDSEDLNDLVREMVLSGSQRLYMIRQDIPDAVAAAKRRAYALRFNVSCVDRVGRLLAVLAAAVPEGGRILEIGTGVGVGTAWISSGLGERSDVEVISVEVDGQLSEAAREWPWPAHVRIVTADVMELLEEIGAFHLIFVDASPIKHGHIESMINLLRPAGVLVVDDLHVGTKNPEEQEAVQNSLRLSVLHHPHLQAVELDWASGVILATRTNGADYISSTRRLC